MNDMRAVIEPKSDQLNADDLIAGPMTVRITGVSIKGGQEQPISVSFEGDSGKPYKPCKSMCRVMVTAWGADSKQYTGRSMTLHRDAKVKWAGMEVGGIRISHMSDIASPLTMALTMTKANKKPYTVKPLDNQSAHEPKAERASGIGSGNGPSGGGVSATPYITDNEVFALDARCQENGIPVETLRKAAKVERLSLIKPEDLPRAHAWVDAVLENRRAKAAI